MKVGFFSLGNQLGQLQQRAVQPLPSADTGLKWRKLNSSFLSLKGKEVLLSLSSTFMF